MNMDNFLFIAIGFVVCLPICYFFYHRKIIALDLSYSKQRDELLLKMKQEEKEFHIEIKKAKENELTVVIYPWKDEQVINHWYGDDRTLKIGYQYQLFIRGVPCFEPYKVATETLHNKQINQKRIDQAFELAVTAMQAIAAKHPAILAASQIPKPVKSQ